MSKMDRSYAAVTGRKAEIIRDAIGVDYSKYEKEGIVFDYEALMADTGYTLEDHIRIQQEYNVGNTPIFELHNLTALARKCAAPGKGARIFVKDEASTPPAPSKSAAPQPPCITPRRWVIRALWPPPPATTALPWPLRPPCRV